MERHEQQLVAASLTRIGVSLGAELSPQRLKIYLEDLQDVPFDALRVALERAGKQCKFFPSVAELRELAGGQQPSLEDQAIAAWDSLRCLRKGWKAEALDDPLIRRCFDRLGGFNSFASWDYEKEEKWKRREFIELYQALVGTKHYLPLTHEESKGVLSNLNSTKALSHHD